MVRERAGSATELGEILDLAADAKGGEGMEVDDDDDDDDEAMEGGGRGDSPGAGGEAEGWPSVQRLVR